MSYNKVLWRQILELGKKQELSVEDGGSGCNALDKDDVTTIIATMEFFNATDTWMKQTYYDLVMPKFRVFDWLAMCVMARNDDNRKQNELALKVLVHSYIKSKGVVKEFISDLRITDYDIDQSYEKVVIDGTERLG